MVKIYEKDPMMVGRKISDEFILVPIRQEIGDLQCMYTLNKVGGRIWELLDGNGTTLDAIVATVVEEFEVEVPEARADVIEFLEQMKRVGAVVER
jgi:hypothetical protein